MLINKRYIRSKWEHLCRWFRRTGIWLVVAFFTSSNVYMFLERKEAVGIMNSTFIENQKLKETNDSLRSDYIQKIAYKQTIDSITKASFAQLLEAEKLKMQLISRYQKKADSILNIK